MNLFVLIYAIMLQALPSNYTIHYSFSSGTVAPPYKYKYTIDINSKGEGLITYTPDAVLKTSWTEKFVTSKSDIRTIYKYLKSSGSFNKKWTENENNPLGGSTENVKIVAKNQSITIPSFPKEKDDADKIMKMIKKLIPENLINSYTVKKDALVKAYLEGNK